MLEYSNCQDFLNSFLHTCLLCQALFAQKLGIQFNCAKIKEAYLNMFNTNNPNTVTFFNV